MGSRGSDGEGAAEVEPYRPFLTRLPSKPKLVSEEAPKPAPTYEDTSAPLFPAFSPRRVREEDEAQKVVVDEKFEEAFIDTIDTLIDEAIEKEGVMKPKQPKPLPRVGSMIARPSPPSDPSPVHLKRRSRSTVNLSRRIGARKGSGRERLSGSSDCVRFPAVPARGDIDATEGVIWRALEEIIEMGGEQLRDEVGRQEGPNPYQRLSYAQILDDRGRGALGIRVDAVVKPGSDITELRLSQRGLTPVSDDATYVSEVLSDLLFSRRSPEDMLEQIVSARFDGLVSTSRGRELISTVLSETVKALAVPALHAEGFEGALFVLNRVLIPMEGCVDLDAHDKQAARLLMNVASILHRPDDFGRGEFVMEFIKGYTVWQRVSLWRYMLTAGIAQLDLGADQDQFEKGLVGLMSSSVYNMVMWGLDAVRVRGFIDGCAVDYALSPSHHAFLTSCVSEFQRCFDASQISTTSRVRPATTASIHGPQQVPLRGSAQRVPAGGEDPADFWEAECRRIKLQYKAAKRRKKELRRRKTGVLKEEEVVPRSRHKTPASVSKVTMAGSLRRKVLGRARLREGDEWEEEGPVEVLEVPPNLTPVVSSVSPLCLFTAVRAEGEAYMVELVQG